MSFIENNDLNKCNDECLKNHLWECDDCKKEYCTIHDKMNLIGYRSIQTICKSCLDAKFNPKDNRYDYYFSGQ